MLLLHYSQDDYLRSLNPALRNALVNFKSSLLSPPNRDASKNTVFCVCLSGLSTVEAYNHKTNEWMYVGPMNTRRSSVGVGVVNGETELVVCVSSPLSRDQNSNLNRKQLCVFAGKLYAVGGYDGASRQCLSTVEEYDPATNQWCYVADMSTRRSGAGTHTS